MGVITIKSLRNILNFFINIYFSEIKTLSIKNKLEKKISITGKKIKKSPKIKKEIVFFY